MMHLKLVRYFSDKEHTRGLLFVDGEFECYTLEDQYNFPKVPKETRIPAGRYKITLRKEGGMTKRYGQRFDFHEGMIWIRDIPDFTYVYIHVGNDDDDTEGCPLVGNGVQGDTITGSVAAYTPFYKKVVKALKSEQVWITVEDE